VAARSRNRRQLRFAFRTWGGARAGAGRRPKRRVAGVSHLRRPAHSRHHPVHVTLRVRRGISSLRGRGIFGRVQNALAYGQERFGFRLVHFSVQRDHLHLIAEASDRRALSRGMQGLTIRVARAVNRQLGRSGSVLRSVIMPARCALRDPCTLLSATCYSNARKHERREHAVPAGFVDECSSGP